MRMAVFMFLYFAGFFSLVTLAAILTSALGTDAPARVSALIRGLSRDALQGLISGSADLDKIASEAPQLAAKIRRASTHASGAVA